VESRKVARLLRPCLTIGLTTLLLLAGTTLAFAGTSGYYAVSAVEVGGASLWNGVQGTAWCSNTTEASGSFMVRSIWVQRGDSLYACETGWCDHNEPGQPSACTLFVQLLKNGGYLVPEHLGTITSGTNQTFKVNYNGDQHWWNFWYAGTCRATRVNSGFEYGIAGSQSEAHNSSDYLGAHWWNLKRSWYPGPLGPWLALQPSGDTSPNWRVLKIDQDDYEVVPE